MRTFRLSWLAYSPIAVLSMVLSACGSNDSSPGGDTAHPSAVRALAGIAANPKLALAGPDDSFLVRAVLVDPDGREHVRFDRTYRGLPVIGGDVVVHDGPGGAIEGVSHELVVRPVLGSIPTLSRDQAVGRATSEVAGTAQTEAARLVVHSLEGAFRLAYEVVVNGLQPDGGPSEMHVFVDAHSGEILEQWDGIETSLATGTGNGFFDGTLVLTTDLIGGSYALRDPSRGNQFTTDMNNGTTGNGTLFTDADNTWGDGTLSNRQTIAVDAQYGTAATWDYYRETHGRTGIANDGKGSFNRVHYSSGYNNAFWSDTCFCMTYGDGDGTTFNPFDSLDVAGHEMSHGVTSRTAGLVYSQESGGLNEATSDIFGTSVEFFANNANDAPDYLIGERLYKSGNKALRYMYRPSKDGSSADCWSRNLKRLDVHFSSGPANHFFYLLSEGSGVSSFTDATGATTCNGATVTGIGRAAAEKIWYRALTVYMTSRTNYAGARTATLAAARDLDASGTWANAVAAAWSAVNVN
jgi:zinc metalloprotease ZmpA